jgi:predicted nucleic acid-binding protein
MNDKPFFDTNVILYAFSQDDTRGQVAETLLAAGGALSVQVLNEFVAVARRKLDKSWEEVRRALDVLRIFLSRARATYDRDPRESRACCRAIRVFNL